MTPQEQHVLAQFADIACPACDRRPVFSTVPDPNNDRVHLQAECASPPRGCGWQDSFWITVRFRDSAVIASAPLP